MEKNVDAVDEGLQTFIHYRVSEFTTYAHVYDEDDNLLEKKEIKFRGGIFRTSDPDCIATLEARADYGVHILNANAFEKKQFVEAKRGVEKTLQQPVSADAALDAFLDDSEES